jgi:hypothetical protein
MQAAIKSMGMKLPEQISKLSLTIEDWDGCDRLLTAHGAQ